MVGYERMQSIFVDFRNDATLRPGADIQACYRHSGESVLSDRPGLPTSPSKPTRELTRGGDHFSIDGHFDEAAEQF